MMFVFGGEFSNPNQTQFHHYRDFWRLDLQTNEWAKIDAKGRGPTARSGHRMAGVNGQPFVPPCLSLLAPNSSYARQVKFFFLEDSVTS
eukprot:SAG31_NODE_5829_length_2306_cov_1.319891_2_plen_89_part_00